MSISATIVGEVSETVRREWTERDVMLYALSVGTVADDPLAELDYTTENCSGVDLRVLPGYAAVLAGPRIHPALGAAERSRLLHAAESITSYAPIPAAGAALSSARIAGIEQRRSGVLITTVAELTDETSETVLAQATWSLLVRGESLVGEPVPVEPASVAIPERNPDRVLTFTSRPDQALLYRLNGDRNPLHCDPVVAERVGFARPILHGLCTYGMTARAVARTVAGTAGALQAFAARFSSPVVPGDTLSIQLWHEGDRHVTLRALNSSGAVVLDDGTMTFTKENPVESR